MQLSTDAFSVYMVASVVTQIWFYSLLNSINGV